MEKKRISSAVESLNKRAAQKGLQFPKKITVNSLCYMDLIREIDNPTISYLSELLGVSKSAVTMKISELEKLGYVIKTVSNKDKRVKKLELSNEMKKIYNQFDFVDEDIYREINDKFSKEALDNFCEILDFISDKIIDNIKK
jgi:DNA-binding MarR family transcriptional regulator